ncbi:MAG: hypothetical protein ACRELD_03725 [Longimicrobiales bacterium]
MRYALPIGRGVSRLRPARALLLGAGLPVAAFLLIACEGENLFRGDARAQQPQVTELNVPDSATAGAPFPVQLQVIGARGIARIDVSLRGATVRDTSLLVSPPQTQVSTSIVFQMPPTFFSSSLDVGATAVDAQGAVSTTRSTSVPAVEPPPASAVARGND